MAPYKQFCDYCCIVIFFRYHIDLLNYQYCPAPLVNSIATLIATLDEPHLYFWFSYCCIIVLSHHSIVPSLLVQLSDILSLPKI